MLPIFIIQPYNGTRATIQINSRFVISHTNTVMVNLITINISAGASCRFHGCGWVVPVEVYFNLAASSMVQAFASKVDFRYNVFTGAGVIVGADLAQILFFVCTINLSETAVALDAGATVWTHTSTSSATGNIFARIQGAASVFMDSVTKANLISRYTSMYSLAGGGYYFNAAGQINQP
jgi:hypothetical protein